MLRKATIEDYAAITAIAQSAFPTYSPLPPELIQQHLKGNRVQYLLNDEETAFLSFSQVLDEIEIGDLAVIKVAQGQGLGQELLANFLAKHRQEHIFLEVAEGNRPARHIYEKLGFRQYHERPNYYQDGQTAILMEKKS